MSTANLSFIAILLSCDTFFQKADTAEKRKDNNMDKSKEPESQTKYSLKNKHKGILLGIAHSQRTQKHGNL